MSRKFEIHANFHIYIIVSEIHAYLRIYLVMKHYKFGIADNFITQKLTCFKLPVDFFKRFLFHARATVSYIQ